MLEALIPYKVFPTYTLLENIPVFGELKLQPFGPLVATGVILGWRQCLKYAKEKDIDEVLFRDYMFWVLVSAFVISHWVSVVAYFPEQIADDPWVLLKVWNGLSSVGGFFGAFIGMMVYLKMKKQPIMVFADASIFGLMLGWCFGRAGCSVVHDHPGRIVEESNLLAVGPWPDGTWRYDLGMLELVFIVTLASTIYFVIDWRSKRPGWLVGLVATVYAPYRFLLDFARADEAALGVIGTPDARYIGLTPAQWFTVTFFLAGLWLLFVRREKPGELDYAKDSERIAAEKAAASGSDEDSEDDGDDEDEAGSDADDAKGDGARA